MVKVEGETKIMKENESGGGEIYKLGRNMGNMQYA